MGMSQKYPKLADGNSRDSITSIGFQRRKENVEAAAAADFAHVIMRELDELYGLRNTDDSNFYRTSYRSRSMFVGFVVYDNDTIQNSRVAESRAY